MMGQLVRFVGLFCGGVTAGIATCVLLTDRIWAGTGQFYTELMQLLARALAVPAPVLGALGLLAMSVDAALLLRRGGSTEFWLAAGAVALALGALLLTKLGHFPINAQILAWNPTSPPPEWTALQARWSALHLLRTLAGVGSFSLYLLSNVVR